MFLLSYIQPSCGDPGESVNTSSQQSACQHPAKLPTHRVLSHVASWQATLLAKTEGVLGNLQSLESQSDLHSTICNLLTMHSNSTYDTVLMLLMMQVVCRVSYGGEVGKGDIPPLKQYVSPPGYNYNYVTVHIKLPKS